MTIRALSRFLLVAYFLEAGLLLSVVPWSEFWDRHMLLLWWPALRPLVGNAFVRGAVTGIGLVTLVAGVTELGTWLFPRRGASAPDPAVDAASHGPGA